MIHLALIIGIGLLIFRNIWLIFNFLQSLITRKTSLVEQKEVKNSLKQQAPSSKPVTSKQKSLSKSTAPLPMKSQEPAEKKSGKMKEEQMRPQRSVTTSSILKETETGKARSSYSQVSKQGEFNDWINQKKIFEEKIARLNLEVEKHCKQKMNYIQRIEDIIEHIANQKDISAEKEGSIDEENLSSIYNLKRELAAANQKMQDQKNDMIAQFSNQKKSLIEEYELKLEANQQANSAKIMEYMNVIDQITQRVYQLEEEKSQRHQEQSQSGSPIKDKHSQETAKELQAEKIKNQLLQKELKQIQNTIKKIKQQQPESKKEIQHLKQQLAKSQNDNIEVQTKLSAEIESLSIQTKQLNIELVEEKESKFKLEQQLQQLEFKHKHSTIEVENKRTQSLKTEDLVDKLEKEIKEERNRRQEQERKFNETFEELKFCQQQLKNARDTETELRNKLIQALDSPKKSERTLPRKEDVEKHPDYISLKRKVEQLEAQRQSNTLGVQKKSAIMGYSYNSPSGQKEQREKSPTFPIINYGDNPKAVYSPNSEYRASYKSGIPPTTQQPVQNLGVPASTINFVDRRYKTPSEKPIIQSTINEGDILSQIYFGQTDILDEAQRNVIIHEITALKKITVKRTRLMYSSAQKVSKSITEYFLSIPNMIVLAELANKSVVGAFTQNAFSKENRFTQSTVVSKAMIFSLIPQTFIVNEGKGQIIHFQENTVMWGNHEFVINCGEQLSISVNLNCQNCVYPSALSTKQFLESAQDSVPISKLEVHRIFFG